MEDFKFYFLNIVKVYVGSILIVIGEHKLEELIGRVFHLHEFSLDAN
jgi:hypothetical protein